MVKLALEHLGAKRLEIRCDARNAASCRVAERCGFELEGVLHQCQRDMEGKLCDMRVYAWGMGGRL